MSPLGSRVAGDPETIRVSEKSPRLLVAGLLRLRFYADLVVHRSANPLLAAEITLGCLHGHVPEEELHLVQLSACGMAQAGYPLHSGSPYLQVVVESRHLLFLSTCHLT